MRVYVIGYRSFTEKEKPKIEALIKSADWCIQVPYEGFGFRVGARVPGIDGLFSWEVTSIESDGLILNVGKP